MTVEAETKSKLTDEELLDRIRAIQAELGSIDTQIAQLCEEVDIRRIIMIELQERGRDLNNELHELVSVPCRLYGIP